MLKLFTVLEVANCEYGNFNEALSKENLKYDWRKKSVPSPKSVKTYNNGKNEGSLPAKTRPSELYKFGVLYKRCIIQLYRDWVSKTTVYRLLNIVFESFYRSEN